MRKLRFIGLGLALLFTCVVFCGQADAGQMTLRIADVNPNGHIIVDALHHFAAAVDKHSNGTMKVEVYPAGQLGDDSICYELLQMGGLDFYRGNASSLVEYGKIKMAVTALPYIFRDRDHFWKVCRSPLGQMILDDLQASGIRMVGLAYLDEGNRNFFTTKIPVKKLSDLKGQKIRVQNAKLMLETVKALGANPTPIDYNELYTALQTGVVDGAENPPTGYLANLFYEPAPNYVRDGHTYSPSILLASEITWGRLTPEQKEAVKKACDDTMAFNLETIAKADEAAYAKMRELKVNITDVEDIELWIKAMDPVYKEFGADYLDLIKEIQAVK